MIDVIHVQDRAMTVVKHRPRRRGQPPKRDGPVGGCITVFVLRMWVEPTCLCSHARKIPNQLVIMRSCSFRHEESMMIMMKMVMIYSDDDYSDNLPNNPQQTEQDRDQ